MSKQEERAQKATQWLAHLQGWKDSGQSVSAYAKAHGLALWAMYHWRGVLIREGRWQEPPKATDRSRVRSSLVPLRFARVAVVDAPRAALLIVRVQLGNGRHAEIELGELDQLGEVLEMLERRA